jgi:hypothetical protein
VRLIIIAVAYRLVTSLSTVNAAAAKSWSNRYINGEPAISARIEPPKRGVGKKFCREPPAREKK